MENQKIKITCNKHQKEIIKKALFVSGECPIEEACDEKDDCKECPEKRIQWELLENGKGKFECFHCGETAVVWDNDFDNPEGEGIIRRLHCESCKAEIAYYIEEEGEAE